MKIRICIFDRKYRSVEVVADIELMKRNLEEKTWSKYGKVELTKAKRDDLTCCKWRGNGHRDENSIVGYEVVKGYSEYSQRYAT